MTSSSVNPYESTKASDGPRVRIEGEYRGGLASSIAVACGLGGVLVLVILACISVWTGGLEGPFGALAVVLAAALMIVSSVVGLISSLIALWFKRRFSLLLVFQHGFSLCYFLFAGPYFRSFRQMD